MELIELAQSLRPLIATGLAIPLLLLLVLRWRVPAFAALIAVALAAALAAG
ncbi:MAG: Gnt-I system low-affinity gluconate transporter, partial [Maricaulis maris]